MAKSRWLGVSVVALSLAGIISIASSFAGFVSMRSTLDYRSRTSLEVEYKPNKYLTDAQLLHEAAADTRGGGGVPRVAFLFLVRGGVPHEALWRRFFRGHEARYSLYMHATPGWVYPRGSLFYGREIPSKHCPRFSRGIVDALRRLLAHALFDADNAWFVNVCESTVPIRGFGFVHEYLMRSKVSFVESFYPHPRYHSWETAPEFNASDLRKGELWMALERRHARVVVSDEDIYFKFQAGCTWWCTWDEQYVQTLLHLRDAGGIAERTVTYVNWTEPHGGSPHALSVSAIPELQSREWDTDGERHDTAFDNTTYVCSPSPCFLFARKFPASQTQALLSLQPHELGY